MSEESISLPVLLTQEREVAGFDCGKAPLNDFLIKMEVSPTNPLHLFLLFKDIRKSLDAAQKKQP